MLKLFGKVIVLVLAVSLITGVVYAADVTTGMVGYWPLDGNAKDKSGKGNDGTAVGSPQWVNGRVGQAVKLDGATQLIDIPGFKLTTDTATFAVWLNGWKNHTWTGIMMSRGTTSPNGIGFGDGDALHYTWNGDSTWQWHGGPVIPKDTWVMVAVAVEPTLATAYTFTDSDGLKSAVNTTAHLSETIDKLQFGFDSCEATRWFIGMMDEAVIYKRALAKDDIVALATKGLTTAVESGGKLAVTWAGLKK